MPSRGMKMFWLVVHIWPEYRLRVKARLPVTALRSSRLSMIAEFTPAFSVKTTACRAFCSIHSPKLEEPV